MDSAEFILVLEYEGTQYHGFQWQAGVPTIQAELEQAISKLYGENSRVMAASRTDAGVHAKGQVVSFWAKPTLTTTTLVKALNHYLPMDIAVKKAYQPSVNFNVRRHARSREYRYYILNNGNRSPFSQRFSLFMPTPLNIGVMNEACQLILGEPDFRSFVTSLDDNRSTLRYIYNADISRKNDFVIFRITANSFLPHQPRNTMGLSIKVGLGKIDIGGFCDIIEARSFGLAGPTAPPCGLHLIKVNYPNLFAIASETKQSYMEVCS